MRIKVINPNTTAGMTEKIGEAARRVAALERFLDYAKQHEAVWFCCRVDIARHWRERHPYQEGTA